MKKYLFLTTALFLTAAHAQPLEYFSYCSNGECRMINGEFFHRQRNMPLDLNVSCKQPRHYALTFDDGPSRNWPRLLEILKRNNVKATFFVVGSNLKNADNVNAFRQAVSDGHFIANHTYKHEDLTKQSAEEIVAAMENSREQMLNALYPDPRVGRQDTNHKRLEISSRYVRPPFGNIDMRVDSILKSNGYTSVRWNADRYDWNMPGSDPKTSATILERVRTQLAFIADHSAKGEKFNESVLDLNHDGQDATVNAVEELIGIVRENGYEFVTMDVCLGK